MEKLTPERVVEPFLKGLQDILMDTCGIEATAGQMRTTHNPTITLELTVLVGLVGDIEGQVSYSMHTKFACEMAATMLGEAVNEYGEMAESAVCELGNMVTGRAAVELQRIGYDCDLCPPSVIISEKFELSSAKVDTHIVPVATPWGELEMHIAVSGSPGKGRAIREQPKHAPTITGILTAEAFLQDIAKLLENGDNDKALSRARQLKELNFACVHKLGPIFTQMGQQLVVAGDLVDARKLLEAASEFDERNVEAHIALGHCLYEMEAYDLALESFAKAASAQPDQPEGYFNAARCYKALGNVEKAKRAFKVAVIKGHPEAQNELDAL